MENDKDVLLRLENVSYSYGSVSALSDFSMNVARGESVVLLGANGSGKSTVLKILAGLVTPRSGGYSAFGRTISERLLSQDSFGMYFRTSVGMVFQNSDAQLFNPTVEEEIAFGPSQLLESSDEVRCRAREMMIRLRMSHLAERSPFALSGGEKRRVAIASVLVMEPEVLLLDEPTAGLDPRSSRMLLDILLDYRKRGKTLITSTHDLHIVPELASRVVVLGEDRRVVISGTPEEVLSNHSLLHSVNLIHLHSHRHQTESGELWHTHEHDHG